MVKEVLNEVKVEVKPITIGEVAADFKLCGKLGMGIGVVGLSLSVISFATGSSIAVIGVVTYAIFVVISHDAMKIGENMLAPEKSSLQSFKNNVKVFLATSWTFLTTDGNDKEIIHKSRVAKFIQQIHNFTSNTWIIKDIVDVLDMQAQKV